MVDTSGTLFKYVLYLCRIHSTSRSSFLPFLFALCWWCLHGKTFHLVHLRRKWHPCTTSPDTHYGTFRSAPSSEYKYEWNFSKTIIKTFHRIKQNMSSTASFSSTHWKYFRLVLLFVVSLSAVNSASPDIVTTITSEATASKKKSIRPLKTAVKAIKAALKFTRTPKSPTAAVILKKKDGLLAQKDVKFSYHTKNPLKVEGTDIRSELNTPGIDFLYLDADPTIVEYLKLREQNGDAKTFGDISEYLLGVLRASYHGPRVRIEPLPVYNNGPLNYRLWDFKGHEPGGIFHQDGVCPGLTMANVWIALEDVKARPLAFMKTHGKVFPSSQEPVMMPFDSSGEYIVVENMLKGEMLVFYANENPHGSLVIDKNYGPRKSVTFAYTLQH
jgi:hypothetical protein